MRVSINWLKKLVNGLEEVSLEDIAHKLTMAGLEVEAVEDPASRLQRVVVAKILEKHQHPKADKLSLCVVDAGAAQPVRVVCGAPNHQEGDWVVFAQVGASLPNGMDIVEATIRGEKSFGMLCSEAELGISKNHDGIIILSPQGDWSAGQPAAAALGQDDVILELGITPNRPDALSHVGIARELGALLGLRLNAPQGNCVERGGAVDAKALVQIEDAVGCPRYACRVIEGVEVAASPQWLQNRLEACGVRAINNVVDVTNWVLLELGHPLHAFDWNRLSAENGRAQVVVRRARQGELLKTIDDEERKLSVEDLVIADGQRPIALAGVMGGADSEVSQTTETVLLESAYFKPATVRKSAKRHGLHTEASHRFERGCDPNGVERALNRAASLILELSPNAQVLRGTVDVQPKEHKVHEVSLRIDRLAALSGLPSSLLDERAVSERLQSIGIEVVGRDGQAIRFRVPSFRPDLLREVDLIEEVVRLIGYDQVPSALPAPTQKSPAFITEQNLTLEKTLTQKLIGWGFHEAVNFAFGPEALFNFFKTSSDRLIEVKNPLGEEMAMLRPSLLPALLQNLIHNLRHGNRNVRLFEMATTFHGQNPKGQTPRPSDADGPQGGDAWAAEAPKVAGLWSGSTWGLGFDRAEKPVDFFDLKGVVEDLLGSVNLKRESGRIIFEAANDEIEFLHPRSATYIYWRAGDIKTQIGVVGEIHPYVSKHLNLEESVFVFELNLASVVPLMEEVVIAKPLPRFPAVKRDFAVLLEENLPASRMLQAIWACEGVAPILESVDIFDVYRGARLPEGKKSIAFSVVLRAADRTLNEEEVQNGADALLTSLASSLGAEIR